MKVLCASYNIHFGIGQDGQYDLGRIVDTVRDADIIAMQEVIQGWPAAQYADQAAEIAEALNFHYVYGSTFDVDASETGADGTVHNRRRRFGNMVASRWPIRTSRTLPLPHNALPHAFDLQRCAVEAVVAVPGRDVRVYSAHTSHVAPGQRMPQVEALLEMIGSAPAQGKAWDHEYDMFQVQGLERCSIPDSAILMGDLNFSPQEPEYPVMCGEVTPFVGRQPRADQLLDAWVLAGNDEKVGDSFNEPQHPGYRIDHCLLTHDLVDAVTKAWLDSAAKGSDHYPLFVELNL